jgi:hypothetical protein
MHQTSTVEENEHGLHIWSALSCFSVLGDDFVFIVKTAAMFPYQFSSFCNSFTQVHFSIHNIFKNCMLAVNQVFFFT